MISEDIIRMARESGGADITSHGWTSWVGVHSTEFLERFAALVAAAEREACAKVCDERERANLYGFKECADAIRARGERK
jgi:hypothetical protein